MSSNFNKCFNQFPVFAAPQKQMAQEEKPRIFEAPSSFSEIAQVIAQNKSNFVHQTRHNDNHDDKIGIQSQQQQQVSNFSQLNINRKQLHLDSQNIHPQLTQLPAKQVNPQLQFPISSISSSEISNLRTQPINQSFEQSSTPNNPLNQYRYAQNYSPTPNLHPKPNDHIQTSANEISSGSQLHPPTLPVSKVIHNPSNNNDTKISYRIIQPSLQPQQKKTRTFSASNRSYQTDVKEDSQSKGQVLSQRQKEELNDALQELKDICIRQEAEKDYYQNKSNELIKLLSLKDEFQQEELNMVLQQLREYEKQSSFSAQQRGRRQSLNYEEYLDAKQLQFISPQSEMKKDEYLEKEEKEANKIQLFQSAQNQLIELKKDLSKAQREKYEIEVILQRERKERQIEQEKAFFLLEEERNNLKRMKLEQQQQNQQLNNEKNNFAYIIHDLTRKERELGEMIEKVNIEANEQKKEKEDIILQKVNLMKERMEVENIKNQIHLELQELREQYQNQQESNRIIFLQAIEEIRQQVTQDAAVELQKHKEVLQNQISLFNLNPSSQQDNQSKPK